jgi:hypothetical protein
VSIDCTFACENGETSSNIIMDTVRINMVLQFNLYFHSIKKVI